MILKNIRNLIKLGLMAFTMNSFANEELTIMTENWPPLNYIKQEKLIGPSIDIVKAIQKTINNKSEIQVYPWKRAYEYTLEQDNRVLFSMIRSEKRENLFKWVGPIAEKRYSLYAKTDFKHKIKTLEDARDFLIGVQREGFTEQYLKVRSFTKLKKLNYSTQSARMLMKKRIDMLFDSHSTFLKTLTKYDMKESDFKEVFRVKVKYLYIAFSKNVDDKTILLWQNAYNQLYKNGEIKEIYERHDSQGLYWQKSLLSD